MKPKKSTSHVTELKKRVKERILGKGEAPSSTSQTEIPQGTDVPPLSEKEAAKALKNFKKNIKDVWDEVAPQPMEFDESRKVWVQVGATEQEKNDILLSPKPLTLAQNVLSRLTSKCPSSPSVIPRGIPIK